MGSVGIVRGEENERRIEDMGEAGFCVDGEVGELEVWLRREG